jgi:hypothetical protein
MMQCAVTAARDILLQQYLGILFAAMSENRRDVTRFDVVVAGRKATRQDDSSVLHFRLII